MQSFLKYNILSLVVSLTSWLALVNSSRLSYELQSYDNQCFYIDAVNRHVKSSLYFAVYRGNDFQVDFTINSPSDVLVLEGKDQRQGDYVFTVNEIGEYKFCFSNPTSNVKLLDFDIVLEGDEKDHSPLKFKDPQHLTTMDKALTAIRTHSQQIRRDQRTFRVREGRNEGILHDITNSVHFFSVTVVVIVAIIALIQVLAIRSFFSSKRRG